ncbi:hypothetical protein ACFWNT_28640 [Streptomyces sp. NPDC058409]
MASIEALPTAHPEIDWEQLRTVQTGRRSLLASLRPKPEAAPA